MSPANEIDPGRSSTVAAARWSGRRFGGCLVIAVGISIVVGCLGTWGLIRADEFDFGAFLPLLLPASVLWIAVGLWRLHRREDREINRFEHRPSTERDEFLDAMGIDRSSEFAEIATAARAKLAELGCVRPESIRASDRFFPDLQKLPFYDSIDFLEVVLTLEQELGIRIAEDDQSAICEGVAKGTVGDVVDHAVRIYRDQHGEKTG
jgi:acyl carrier protein